MGLFIIGLVLAAVGAVLLAVPMLVNRQRILGLACGGLALALSLIAIAFSTAIYVNDSQGGIVIRKFGDNLPSNRVVASQPSEMGPQAKVLGPGWHFGFWPWIYDLDQVPTITIDQGQVGVVSALDGKSLPNGEIFAEAWTSPEEMLDGEKFLTAGKGFRGPQLTVLTPGRYRYNPRLFDVKAKPALEVDVGEVAVIKANAGPVYVPPAGTQTETINGTPLVPRDFRGIWVTALEPNAYYLHPDAFQVKKVKTTNLVFTYKGDEAMTVRSADGFTFPVDVRVSVAISAANAPKVVALLSDPHAELASGESGGESTTGKRGNTVGPHLSVLEAKVILPNVRTIFRNVAETMPALKFISSRSEVERSASEHFKTEMQKYHIDSEGLFIGNIDLASTDAGKLLIATQTDREVAVNQQKTFGEKQAAEESRAKYTLAQAEAEQQTNLASAKYKVLVAEQEAKAREAMAGGEAKYIEITFEARKKGYESLAKSIGAEGVTMLELFKLISDGQVQITPQVMVNGAIGGNGTMEALAGTILGRSFTGAAPAPKATPAAAPAPAAK